MISFPRLMPTVGAAAQSFEPQRVDYAAPEAGGRLGGVQAGFPLWAMQVDLNAMQFDDADVWRAWLAVQRGAQRPFLAFDIDRQAPKRHAGGTPFSKTASGWSQAINADGLALLTLAGMLPGTILSLGDYVGLRWDGAGDAAGSHKRRALTRVVASASTLGDGAITVAVEPPLAALVPPGAQAHLDRPCCVMRLLQETELARAGLGHMAAGGRIVAIEDLRP